MKILLILIFGSLILTNYSMAETFDCASNYLVLNSENLPTDKDDATVQNDLEKMGDEAKDSAKESEPWYESLINNTLFWIGILLPFIFLFIIAFSVKRKIVQRNKKERDTKT